MPPAGQERIREQRSPAHATRAARPCPPRTARPRPRAADRRSQNTRAWKQGADAEIRVSSDWPSSCTTAASPQRNARTSTTSRLAPGCHHFDQHNKQPRTTAGQNRGDLFSPRRELLLLNERDRSDLVDGLQRQIDAVRTAATRRRAARRSGRQTMRSATIALTRLAGPRSGRIRATGERYHPIRVRGQFPRQHRLAR
jgi:hypothetical protein